MYTVRIIGSIAATHLEPEPGTSAANECDTNAKCTVIDSKTKERADCVFPFTLSTDPEKVYTNCTNFLKGERFWCSTKVRYIF